MYLRDTTEAALRAELTRRPMDSPDLLTPPAWTGPAGPVRLAGRRQPYQAPVAACAAEIQAIPAGAWTRLTMHRPDAPIWRVAWSAHTLRGYSADARDAHSPTTRQFRAAAHGAVEIPEQRPEDLMLTTAAPAFPACLAMAERIPGRSERIRILQLGPAGIIPKHRDPLHEPRWEDRTIVRFHIPIIVPEGCVFFAWDRRGQVHQICEPLGSVWFVDTDLPHMAVNASLLARYHLVIDKFLDDELRETLMASASPGEAAIR
jgi:hypothetical protein